jgi:TP901 family phage tail tape measure protein
MGEIRFRFVATGAGSVVRAKQSIEAAGKKLAASEKAEYAARRRLVAARKRELNERFAQERRVERASEGLREQRIKDAERNNAKLKRAEARHARESLAEAKRAERKKTSLRERAARDRVRLAERAERHQERVARRAQRRRHQMRRHIGRQGLGLAARGIGVTMGVGALLAGGAVRQDINLRAIASRTAVQARHPGMTYGTTAIEGKQTLHPDVLTKKYRQEAIRSGLKSEDIALGMERFVARTGNLKQALKIMSTMTTTAKATASSVEEVADAMASAFEHFGVKSIEDSQRMLAKFTVQGKKGAIEIKDMARFFQELAPLAAGAGVSKGVLGMEQIGNLFQIARLGTGKPEQAKTALQNMLTYMGKKSWAPEMRKAGVKVYEGEGEQKRMRNINDIIMDVMMKVGGADPEKKVRGISKLFNIRGTRFFNPLMKEWQQARAEGVKGGKTGDALETYVEQRVRGMLERFLHSGTSWSEMLKDFAAEMSTTKSRLTVAWEKFAAIASEDLTPVVHRLATALPKLLPAAKMMIHMFVAVTDTLVWFMDLVGQMTGKGKIGTNRLMQAKLEEKRDAQVKELAKAQTMVAREEQRTGTPSMSVVEKAEQAQYELDKTQGALDKIAGVKPEQKPLTEDEWKKKFGAQDDPLNYLLNMASSGWLGTDRQGTMSRVKGKVERGQLGTTGKELTADALTTLFGYAGGPLAAEASREYRQQRELEMAYQRQFAGETQYGYSQHLPEGAKPYDPLAGTPAPGFETLEGGTSPAEQTFSGVEGVNAAMKEFAGAVAAGVSAVEAAARKGTLEGN